MKPNVTILKNLSVEPRLVTEVYLVIILKEYIDMVKDKKKIRL